MPVFEEAVIVSYAATPLEVVSDWVVAVNAMRGLTVMVTLNRFEALSASVAVTVSR